MDLGRPKGMDFLMAKIHMGTEGAAFLSGPCWEWHLLNKIFTSFLTFPPELLHLSGCGMEQFRQKVPSEPRPEQSLWNVLMAGVGLIPPAELHSRPQNIPL